MKRRKCKPVGNRTSRSAGDEIVTAEFGKIERLIRKLLVGIETA